MNIALTAFNNGEVTPLIHERTDVEKYSASCRQLVNCLPMIYGAVTRRPGTEYIATAKFSPQPVLLIPFIYSSDTAYMCEFGPGYIRFYFQGAPLADSTGNLVEVLTSYQAADLPQIQYKQVGDVMWLVHPNYPPAQLKRTSPTSFTLTDIAFTNGPFLVRNDIQNNDGVTMTPSVSAVGATGTLTASVATFDAEHVNSLWQLTQTRSPLQQQINITSGLLSTTAMYIRDTFTVMTTGTWSGTVTLSRSEDSAHAIWDVIMTWAYNADANVQYAGTENADNIQYKVSVSAYTSGSGTAVLAVNSSIQVGVVQISEVVSSTVANITVVEALASTSATVRWAEGSWSGVRGYPTAISFFQDRIIYAGTSTQPQTVWFSGTDDYQNFEEGVNDADPFEITMAATNRIRWLAALDTVAVGTAADEWRIASTSITVTSVNQGIITPTTATAACQTTYGSLPLPAVKINQVALFPDFVGRKVREFAYRFAENKYVAPDLTAMAEHITVGGIVSMALQKNPNVVLWAWRGDGVLLSMTYERDQNVIAWARHMSGENAVAFGTLHAATGIGEGNPGGLPGSSSGSTSPVIPPPPLDVPTSCPAGSGDWSTISGGGGPLDGLAQYYKIQGYTDGMIAAHTCADASAGSGTVWDGTFASDPGASCYWHYLAAAASQIDNTLSAVNPAYTAVLSLASVDGNMVWDLSVHGYNPVGPVWYVIWEGQKGYGADPTGVYTQTAGECAGPPTLTVVVGP